ncbi:MAG TPA: tetratricopeptide repeat protein, partial [Chthonomonadaceae bacterium]|nr:tetratricopeptide repeat protein [Chthonomonadaceae bacterium]
MSTESLCEQLLAAPDDASRGTLLEEAARTADCLAYLLETARDTLAAQPAYASRRAELAIAIADRRDDARGASAAWRLHAQARRAEGAHAEAERALQMASTLAASAGERLLAAQAQIGRIDSLGWLGRYDEAAALARRLERELLALNAPQDAAMALVNLGSLHYRRDQYDQALRCYRRALGDLAGTGDALATARIEANIANVLVELNR